MRRRSFVQVLAGAPAASALLAQQPATTPLARGVAEELPKLGVSGPDAVADMSPRFFTPPQFAALRKVSDLLMPAMNGAAGGLDAKAPEFLDFLIGDSPAARQEVYRAGLDGLNAQAKKRFNKTFGELEAADAAGFLAPLQQAWTFDPPADPVAQFLHVAKQDVRLATMNSREYGAAASGGARRFGGGGLYWYPLD
jgi:hypothetical protein